MFDANDKAAVQADIDALKAVIAEITDDQNITDAQIESLKNGKEKYFIASQIRNYVVSKRLFHTTTKRYTSNCLSITFILN